MVDMICAELLLSGVLAIKGPRSDLDKDNNVIFERTKVTYVVPDRYNIENNPCKSEQILSKKGIDMSAFIRKVD